ncbi:MAG: AAA family ATPase, partial [Phycisphaeraceae bacterium]|nr:AAA family ATPase [Phycisphaeraceae bacterium]
MKRELSSKLKALILDRADQRVIILEGARQVGKSYLVKDILKTFSTPVFFFDLEKDRSFSRKLDATEDFSDFKALLQDQFGVQEEGLLVIDEAQESRRLAGYVKSFKEDWPQLKVLLTGSSMNRFFGPDIRIPVGRTQSLCLFGFSFTEFVEMVKGAALSDFIRSAPSSVPSSRHALLLELFDQYLKVGGYPETVKAFAAGAPYSDVTSEIMSDCEEDFERKEAYQPELFRGIINGVANYIGSPSKLTHFPATKYHATRALEAMKAWHLVLEVEPRSLDPLRSHFLPKRYLHDLGVINQSRTLSVPQISLITTIE